MQLLNKFLFKEYKSCSHRFWWRMNKPIPDTYVPDKEEEELELEAESSDQELNNVQVFFMEQKLLLEQIAFQWLEQTKTNCTFETQKEVQTEQFSARVDILEHRLDLGKKAIYEIKNAKTVKEDYLWELAFLTYVFRQAGEPITKQYLIHINANYVKTDAHINPAELFVIVDVSAKVRERMSKLIARVQEALDFAKSELPTTLIEEHSCNSKSCAYLLQLFPNLPAKSIFELQGLKTPELKKLLSQGLLSITDLPSSFKANKIQARHIELLKSQETFVNIPLLRAWLDNLEYPLYFLDYEAATGSIPIYEGTSPFQHVVFQYSLHCLTSPKAPLQHFEFLAEGRSLPAAALLKQLAKELDLSNGGSVVVWHDSFEKTRHREMANEFPEFAPFLKDLNERIVDMEKVFLLESGIYAHPELVGKSSVKSILPVLAPEVEAYDKLPIGDGMEAAIHWFRLQTQVHSQEEEQQIRQQLLEYCKLDTFAMVKILEALESICITGEIADK